MQAEARKYLTTETISSFICNGILNFLPGYAIFHHHAVIPMHGTGGMIQDAGGETLIATSLSYLVPALIARSRSKSGKLPQSGLETEPRGNVYVRALLVGVAFTVVLTAINWFLLPRIFGNSVNLWQEVWFKTWYGAVFGATASAFAIRRAFHEVEAVS